MSATNTNRPSIDRQQIRKIQAVRHARGVDDETWMQMKRSVGVESAVCLNQGQYRELMTRLLGERPRKKAGEDRPRGKGPLGRWVELDGLPGERRPLIRKIMALLLDSGKTWAYADGIVRRMFGVQRVEWCGQEQLHSLVQALSVHGRRKNGGGAST